VTEKVRRWAKVAVVLGILMQVINIPWYWECWAAEQACLLINSALECEYVWDDAVSGLLGLSMTISFTCLLVGMSILLSPREECPQD
jgi:hypothetical protein